ncbi:hypothetical protein QTJ16_005442 [Diplocarpon rosae]|uniref:RRM domain-containing protein n=1 Tax=Diplocarpon rosae TaxID=946125 RepID=A0AAD9SUY8_9HELO|nr:hypothetical protein QTJ16_005442 [Diplocarpon rosae]
MAKDIQSNKRKASVPQADAEKAKKFDSTIEAPAKKRKANDDAAPTKVKKSKTPKPILKGASDLETAEPADKPSKNDSAATIPKDTKKETKAAKNAAVPKPIEKTIVPKPSRTATVSAKKASAAKAEDIKPELEANEEFDSGLADEDEEMEEDSDEEVDDQTLALLKGFESDGDEENEANEGTAEGQPLPERKKLSKKEEKKLKKAAEAGASDKPGVVYIGRIPHGFYENEMKAYFKQFGTILKLRLSRNKHTGASKHYAWIQFESATVADIVARTMDNYLMFGHLLKVKLIPDEQVNPAWFKGANKRFKAVPWNKMQGRKLAQGKSEEAWNEKAEQEEARRAAKADKLKQIGYEFDAPKIKSATGVAKAKISEEFTEGETKAIVAEKVAEDLSNSKKKKKKAKASVATPENPAILAPTATEKNTAAILPPKEDMHELIAEAVEKPKKKAKKVQAVKETEVVVEETVAISEAEVTKPKVKKEKRTKKEIVKEIVEVNVPEITAAVPAKKLKTKKSKSSLDEPAPVEVVEEKIKKPKKNKKQKLDV